ncbi:MAG: TonB-dependent receptor [Chitinophagaceae bacterium]
MIKKQKLQLKQNRKGLVKKIGMAALTLIASVSLLQAQVNQPTVNSTLSGVVRDSATRAPLEGVSIKIEGVTNQTVSDVDGRFTLITGQKLPYPIIVTITGYTTVRLVAEASPIEILLPPADKDLDEVVVAYGKQKKANVVGAVVSVQPTDLKVPSSNLTTALAGRIAGMIAFQRSGEPGADNANFFIRGVTTFGYKVDPLILVDNMEVTTTEFARLQVDDIESFSIMKDATATSIYGARGANGVILVTTKTGKMEQAQLSLRLENSVSTPTRDIEFADNVTYMKLQNEAILTRNPVGVTPYSDAKIDKTVPGADPYLYPNVNWQKTLLKNQTTNQRVNLNVSGGGKVARYFISGSLNKDNGVLNVPKVSNFNNNIDLKSYSLRSNININLTNTTELVVRLNGTFDDYNGPLQGGTKVYHDIMRSNPVLFAPYYPPDSLTSWVQHILFGNYGEGNYLNPYADLVKGYKQYSKSNMYAQLELKQDLSFFLKGLVFNGLFNTTRYSYFDVQRNYTPYYYQLEGLDNSGHRVLTLLNEASGTEYLNYSEGTKSVQSVTYGQASLNYDHTFKAEHKLNALLVGTIRNQLLGNSGSLQLSLPYRNLSLSGRTTYSYASKYFFEFNFGYNGSERFASNNRWGFFPSVGGAWIVSNENFWDGIRPVVSNFKVRFTYGLVGNDAIGDSSTRFFYLSSVNMDNSDRSATFGTDASYTKNGISITRYANNNITWEKAYKTNIGFDLELFHNLTLVADIYKEKRTQIYMQRADIPATVGLQSAAYANLGEAEGRGVDLSLDYKTSFPSGVWIQGRGTFTYAHSQYLKYEEATHPNEPWLSRIGQSINQSWGLVAERLFVDDAEVANSPTQNYGTAMGGDIKYKDVNGDGAITDLDKVPLGKPTVPEINYGFGFSLGYKNFDISAFFQGLARESFWINPSTTAPFVDYTYDGETFANSSVILQNQLLKAYADSHWSEDNQNIYALWPRLSNAHVTNNEETNSWFMRDGSFLRLKQAEIGYTFQKIKVGSRNAKLRVYANGTNLFLLSRFKLWDVEMAGNGLGYPTQRVFNIGFLANL